MPTSKEGINKQPRNQWLCNVVLRLMIFLFDSHQMARLPLMNLVRITDKNRRTKCTQNNNRCNFKYLTVFCVTVFCVTVFCVTVFCVTVFRVTVFCVTVFCVTVFCVTVFCVTVFCVTVQILAKLTHPRIIGKIYFLKFCNLCIYGNTVPQKDLTISSTRCKYNVGKYGFIHAHIAYWRRNFVMDAVLLRVLSGTNDKNCNILLTTGLREMRQVTHSSTYFHK